MRGQDSGVDSNNVMWVWTALNCFGIIPFRSTTCSLASSIVCLPVCGTHLLGLSICLSVMPG